MLALGVAVTTASPKVRHTGLSALARLPWGVAGVMMKPLASRSRRPVFNATSYVIFKKSCICSCLSFLICKLRPIALTSLACWRAPVSVCVKCSEQPLAQKSLCLLQSVTMKTFFCCSSFMQTLKARHGRLYKEN